MIKCHDDEIRDLSLSPAEFSSEMKYATASDDGFVKVW
eukprot:CAMPEP_0201282028 /NCGR_PEP_ID=MMETSP1317-20130820/4652_1 /ASSEMBLY_ACC=CAM_ASM_000770 /TAXON_ID=187299 /ORGANISM="Undescribed Undescribed, Strain Undescribed" /LENGTH=37 /DNA_ID= /DNA_START= /DNA_END= /DNA_ORIENTATION=